MRWGDGHRDVLFRHEASPEPRRGAVSVAVSLHNYERFIEDCLASVAAQTHGAVELIVVDDASSRDASAERCAAWLAREAGRFDRALLLRHRRNRGLAEARNTAFEAARTEYVLALDADNALYPRALERLCAAVEETGAEAAYAQTHHHGEREGLGHTDVWSRHRMRLGNYVDAMALVARAAWREVGGYNHIEGGWEDFDLWCKLMERGMEGLLVPEVLFRYRVHGTSMLRVETAEATERLRVALTLRHPWLDLL